MGTLSYTATVSIDGYAADSDGDFQWSGPGDQVFQFHVERIGAISHEVLGRKTYQLMAYWDAEPEDGAWTAEEQEFAKLWRGLERTVVSTTLGPQDLTFSWDRLVPSLDTEALRQIVDDASGEVEIFGPTTAADAIRAGMVRDFRFFVVPKVVGGGLSALPADARLDLALAEHRVFDDGTVLLHYRSR